LKDAYYFSHDSNAKDDPKCVLLIEQLGLEGYGIFWVLIETLRDQPEYKYPLALIPALARRYNTTAVKTMHVISDYGLFQKTLADDFYTTYVKFKGPINHGRRRLYEINVDQWYALRKQVFERDNYTCVYCGKRGGKLEADHKIPFSRGGKDTLDNLVTCCQKCNRQKHDKTPEEFKKWLQNRGDKHGRT